MDNKVFRQLVEVSRDAATIINTEGTITYVSVSVSGVVGSETEESVGEEGYEYRHTDDTPDVV